MPTKPTVRPRGRPKGSRNLPGLQDFVEEGLKITDAPRPQRAKRGAGVWANMTPEERSAYSAKIRASKGATAKGGKPHGVPKRMKVADYEVHQASQKTIIDKMLKKMSDKGQLPDDPMAVEALKEAMVVLRAPQSAKDKIAAARLILDFTKAKPTTKVEHTVRTAEDILDEMAADDD